MILRDLLGLFGGEPRLLGRSRIPSAGLCRIGLHADNPQLRKHGGVERAGQDERGLCVTGFRDMREHQPPAGNITGCEQFPTTLQHRPDFIR